MNRQSTIRALVGVIGLVLGMWGSGAFAAITGSIHDFNGDTWNSEAEICVVCHTPHNAGLATGGPLWDRDASTATYTPYSSPLGTLDVTLGQPAGASKLCLSCHDGTVAMEAFGGNTVTTTTLIGAINPNKDFGIDLSDDHPISFAYAASTDGALEPEANVAAAGLLIGGVGGDVECASCHDVHNNGAAGAGFLLRVSNTASALCLTCHTK